MKILDTRKTFMVVIAERVVKGAPGMDASALEDDLMRTYRPEMTDAWFRPKVISVLQVGGVEITKESKDD